MCTYGIGLPFDHPIWQNLPQCRCGAPTAEVRLESSWDNPARHWYTPAPASPRRARRKRYEAPVR